MTRALAVLVAALLAVPFGAMSAQPAAVVPNKAYDAVIEGMSCRQQTSGRLDCEYAVGQGVRFRIEGVGQESATVHFVKVDSTQGYTAGFAPLHGCVVVRPATGKEETALAFVSLRDGRVHKGWQHCRQPLR
jgi:hypothetical protein